MNLHLVIPFVVLSVAFSNSASAAIQLTLSSSDNLTNIAPGTTVRVDVLAEALVPLPPVTQLVVEVLFDSSLMGTPTGFHPGSLFDPGFAFEATLGRALGDYSGDSVNLPVSEVVVLFAFDVDAQNNVGQDAFTFGAAFAVGAEGIPVTTGAPLAYSVGPDSGVVPEPASVVVWIALGFMGSLTCRRRRR